MAAIIANAPIDLVGRVDEGFLAAHAIPKGATLTLRDADAAGALFSAFDVAAASTGGVRAFPGGCGANIAADMASLGGCVSLVAPFGSGPNGELARDDLTRRGVRIAGFETGETHLSLLTAVTQDGERSFAVRGGQGHQAPAGSLNTLASDRFLVLDGHLLDDPACTATLVRHATEAMPPAQALVVCPNGPEVIANSRMALEALLTRATLILLSETEALELTACSGIEQALGILQARGLAGAITLGARGVIVFDAGAHTIVPAERVPAEDIVNTNGAGDAFAAGYLRGLEQGMALAEAGALGCHTAARVIRLHGARLEPFD